jgi:hypothetical protein
MPIYYCRFNSVCVDPKCRFQHHHPLSQRQVLVEVLDQFPEHMKLIDDFKPPKKSCACKFGLRCFELDCPFTHCGIEDLEERKKVFKVFNKTLKGLQMKEKIAKEIEERKEKTVDWNDL